MTHNSRRAWQNIRKLSNDPTTPNPTCLVNANQLAHQLLIKGQGTMQTKTKRPILPPIQEGTPTMAHLFSVRILIQKLYNITQNSPLCRVIQNMLSSRRFYVELNNERSRWRKQKNGLPQGSVLSHIPFNIYTNDQPLHNGTRSFIYADDLCVTAQQLSFVKVKTTIEESLSELTQYYRSNNLRENPHKTQVTAFHLRNKEAKKTLKVKWNRTDLENTPHPKYLGVTLDRTLSYKQHIHNTKMTVATRNNLLRKLSSSKWGTNASTIKTTALALSYSVAEYAAPRSAHAYKLDSELNSARRAITGYLKPTNVEELY